jgi:hypothetical protein
MDHNESLSLAVKNCQRDDFEEDTEEVIDKRDCGDSVEVVRYNPMQFPGVTSTMD